MDGMKLSEQLSGPEGKLTRELKSRGYLLPLGRRQDDKLTLAKPEILDDLMAALMLPGDVYAGRVAPMSQEAIERGFDLAGAVTLGAGAVPSGANTLRAGIKAYHGSPHDFDKFDMSKIGTGEGAQAYGHGLYFAEAEDVAKMYRDSLSPVPSGDPVANAWDLANKSGLPVDDLIKVIEGTGDKTPMLEDTLRALKSGDYKNYSPPGHMYEVEIQANPDDFLDWDRPFQSADDLERFAAKFDAVNPDIRRSIEDFGYSRQVRGQPMPDGNDLIREVFGGIGSKNAVEATNMMREAGIPGIRYLDQGSRAATNVNDLRGTVSMWEGAVRKTPNDEYALKMLSDARAQLAAAEAPATRNYVVFDPEIIKIVRKYGIFAALAGGLLTQEQADGLRAQGIADL